MSGAWAPGAYWTGPAGGTDWTSENSVCVASARSPRAVLILDLIKEHCRSIL